MIRAPKPLFLLAAVLCLLLDHLVAQQSADYTAAVPSFKTKYPKTEIVAVNYREEYRFSILTSKDGETKVGASSTLSQTLLPLKDFLKTTDAIFYDDQSVIENVKASTGNSKTVKIGLQCMDYQSDGIFHSDAKVCVAAVPLDAKGVPVTFSYERKYKDVKYLTSIYFHERLPIEEKTLVFYIPDWLEVELREFNFSGFDIKKEVTKDEANHLTKYTYRLKDIPAFEKEYRSPNMAKSFPHIIVVSKSFTDAAGKKTVLFESVKDLYAWYHSLTKDIGNKPDDLKTIVNQLTANKKTDNEKIESIFYWVQDNVRYIAFENGIMGFRPDAAQNVLKNKYGDCKGKANLLAQMLKLAGYDARLTWIGTADLPYDYSLPSLAVDNHMICTVILNGKRYFLDGTEENMPLNEYAHRIQGKQVLIEDGDKYIIDKIPDFPAEKNKVENNVKYKVEGETLTGSYSTTSSGEAKLSLMNVYKSIRNDDKKDALQNFLKSSNPNISVANIKEPAWEDRQKPLQISFDIKCNHQITKAGNELYINLDWEKEIGGLEFDSTRKNDYELNHKVYISTQIELAIPEGYKSDYLPDAVSLKNADYSFEASYALKGNAIVYSKKIIVNTPILRKKGFPAWNQFVKNVNKFYNDQIVLVKK